MTIVTTSWDDGDARDERLAELLAHYGVKGTFYLVQLQENALPEEAIRRINKLGHEIGAHSLTHSHLLRLPREQQQQEIEGGKRWLEGVLGKPIEMFCPPYGEYDDTVVELAKTAGYRGMRTAEQGNTAPVFDPYRMLTTLQVYPLPFRKHDAKHFYWRYLMAPLQGKRRRAMHSLGLSLYDLRSFESAARAAYGTAQKTEGVFHLWGHSWEIEKYGMWAELERVLAFLAARASEGKCRFLTNGEVVRAMTS